MSELGQQRKGSQRANVVRFTPKSDHRADIPDRQLRANSGCAQLQQRHRYSITSSARARSECGTAMPSSL